MRGIRVGVVRIVVSRRIGLERLAECRNADKKEQAGDECFHGGFSVYLTKQRSKFEGSKDKGIL